MENKKLTTEEIQEAKHRLRMNLEGWIHFFNKETGTRVTKLDLYYDDNWPVPTGYPDITLTVTL